MIDRADLFLGLYAWCDGPPYADHWALERARRLLRELEARLPQA
jgi:hypothetical protein